MDTPTITAYYKERDPLKRKDLLEQSQKAGEDPEGNEIRQKLWELRYSQKSEGRENRADGFLGLWMLLEYNKNAGGGLFGSRSVRKEITKGLDRLKFKEFSEKGGLYEELLYRECCHMVKIYMELCEEDRTYGSTLFGTMNMGKSQVADKLKRDIYTTAVQFPMSVGMESELALVTRAAREMYEQHFSEKL